MEDMVLSNIEEAFQKFFPELAAQFMLKDFQKNVITNTLANDNTLCIMQTGGGKSLIYWMSGILLGGITIVVSPLIALIDEQSEKIEKQGFEVLKIHGGISAAKQEKILIDFANGKINPSFIFVSPEKIATDGLFEYCIRNRKDEVKLIVIDEVHCVSQWGNGFRPFYARIPNFLDCIYEDSTERPKTLALTATLNPKELIDICREFKIQKSNILKDKMIMRSEISLKVLQFSKEDEKEDKLWDLIKIHKNEKILVYVYRIESERGVERFSDKAKEKGYQSDYFHGDMTAEERKEIIDKYKNNEINIIFATNAFGMGIDIPDIRVVIHYMIPESAEQYYQEIGRAARDGKAANAYLIYSNKNIDVKRKYFIDASFPNEEKLIKTYKKISGQEAGLHALPYFEDEEIQQCLPYYLQSRIMKILCKGFADLKNLVDVQDKELEDIIGCTKTKNLMTTTKKSKVAVKEIVRKVYENLVCGSAHTSKPLERRLIIEILEKEISQAKMEDIQKYIVDRRTYKHDLLNYLVFLISGNISSNELHQEIGRYLGVEKHNLNKLYSTVKGDYVRSKSEVIIANLLFERGIKYEYEKHLPYEHGKWLEPDFTVFLPNGKELFWEHLGMLGIERYDNRWLEKQDIYDKYFDGQLIITYEGATITESALARIDYINSMV